MIKSKLRGLASNGYHRTSHLAGQILLGNAYIPQQEAFRKLGQAIENAKPFALGKVGHAECLVVARLAQLGATSSNTNSATAPDDETDKYPWIKDTYPMMGLYPRTIASGAAWAERYTRALTDYDIVGLPHHNLTAWSLVRTNHLAGRCLHDIETEPLGYSNRSIPNFPCFMDSLAGKRVLIINPLATFFASRATEATHTACWGNRMKWWNPAAVIPFDIPTALDKPVRDAYPSSKELIAEILGRLDSFEYDVALVGAGSYGMEIGQRCKQNGKVGILLGGMLQLIFGVNGTRWLNLPDWSHLWNDAWVRPPEKVRPTNSETYEKGAYW